MTEKIKNDLNEYLFATNNKLSPAPRYIKL